MKKVFWIVLTVTLFTLMPLSQGNAAVSGELQEKVEALKKALRQNQVRLKQYEYIETIVVSKNGEEKSRRQNRCYYGADGKLTKVPITSSQEPGLRRRGLRGRIIEHKKEEMVDYLQKASQLIQRYVPPNSAQIQLALVAGKASVLLPRPGKGVQLQFRDYLLPGDLLRVDLNLRKPDVTGLRVNTYLDNPKDTVTVNVRFGHLQDGTSYPERTVMNTKKKDITVTMENSGYLKK